MRTSGIALIALSALSMNFFSFARANEAKPSAVSPAPTNNAEAKAEDPYRVPDGGVNELLAFIKRVDGVAPEARDSAYSRKGMPALKGAAERVLKLASAEDRKLDGFDDAVALSLYFRVKDGGDNPRLMIEPLSSEDRQKLLDDLKEHLRAVDNHSQHAVLAATMVPFYHELAERIDLAKQTSREFGELLAKSKNVRAVDQGKKMLASARRLDLPGNQIELTGTVTDGTELDWSTYRGKVVLIDFWATWCGPCIAETPRLKKAWEQYHDRGFEIVGVSLDSNRAALDKYLSENEIPWTNLHDGDFKTNSVATHYGIFAIPCMILVDRDGKVLHLDARGDKLTALLEKQFPAE